jgi:hypothetical protein
VCSVSVCDGFNWYIFCKNFNFFRIIMRVIISSIILLYFYFLVCILLVFSLLLLLLLFSCNGAGSLSRGKSNGAWCWTLTTSGAEVCQLLLRPYMASSRVKFIFIYYFYIFRYLYPVYKNWNCRSSGLCFIRDVVSCEVAPYSLVGRFSPCEGT